MNKNLINHPYISVIMSVYNESNEELTKSIKSVLEQSYTDYEFIIVNDNPGNQTIASVLNNIKDKRTRIINNKKNIGLARSLNIALNVAKGDIIARMDADDICCRDRFVSQIRYMEQNKLDMVGSYIQLIDENDNVIQNVMKFPSSHLKVSLFIKSGSCLPHPSWMVKNEIYKKLNGYRNVPRCEDFDFILRALDQGVKMGNVPSVKVKYRIRNNSISMSGIIDQYLIRLYLLDNRRQISSISEDNLNKYISSNKYTERKKTYIKYLDAKKIFKLNKFSGFFKCITNKFFFIDIRDKLFLYAREFFA